MKDIELALLLGMLRGFLVRTSCMESGLIAA